MKQEDVSALMDGELTGRHADEALAMLLNDEGGRAAWERYHLIGDVLRGGQVAGIPRAAFHASLDAEPTVLAPRVATPNARPRPRWALSAVAGIAAIGFVGWVAWPTVVGVSSPQPPMALVTPVATGSAPVMPASAVGGIARPQAIVPSEQVQMAAPPVSPPSTLAEVPLRDDATDLLLAHQRWSSGYAAQSAVPYARLVADERVRGGPLR